MVDYKSKVKMNVWALHYQMPAVEFRDCMNVQDHSSKIQEHGNNFNLGGEGSTGTILKHEHGYPMMQYIAKDDDGRFSTQLMYDKIYTLANNL